jgi:hypothetical protein
MARDRGKPRLKGTEEKLWLQGKEENYDCKGQAKSMAARDRGKLWLQETDENYGCKGQRKNMAARD